MNPHPMESIPPAGRRRPLWQTLLMAAGLLFLALVLSADDCKNVKVKITTSAGQSAFVYDKKAKTGVQQQQSGSAYHTTIDTTFDAPRPTSATVTFTAPPGATNVTFNPPPDGQRADGTYYWNVTNPSGITQFDVVADYSVSGDPAKVVATATATNGDTGEQAASSHTYQPENGGGGGLADRAPAGGRPNEGEGEDDYYLWHTEPSFYTDDRPLTQELCQDLVDLLQSPDFFVALRVPVYPPALPYTAPYTLPVVFQAEISPTLRLVDRTVWPRVTLLRLALRYRPDFFAFLETELPEAPDEHWLALSAVGDPPASCGGVPELPAGGWDVRASLDLDLGGVKGEYGGRTVLVYFGYRGQAPPFFFGALGGSAGGIATYQGWGITAIGPLPVHLLDWSNADPPFELYPPHAGYFTPTATISMAHEFFSMSVNPVTVDVDWESSMGLPWGLYADAGGTQPLPRPARLTVPAWNSVAFYLIATLPPDAPSGMETVLLTATDVYSPALTTWTSDLVWVGEWLPPPPAPGGRQVYLPLVLRNP